MSRVPLRLRLAAVFALAMAIVLALAAWTVYLRVASDLDGNLNSQLRSRAQDLGALVRRDGSLDATRGRLIERGETFAELLDGDGRVVDSTAPIGRTVLVSAAERARALREPVFADRTSVPGLDEHARLLAVRVTRGGRDFVLVVGATRENIAETLASLRNAFLVGGPLALLLASLGGYLLAGAALRPIEAMRRRAAAISVASVGERLPVPAGDDEVSRLGTTLNEMLARLEAGLERERRFAADASHELRTPLALLKTELELALRRARTREELEAAIRSAAAEADRVARIADDLLLLARADGGRLPLRLEATDVGDVIESAAGRYAVRARSDERRIVVEPGPPLVVAADRLRLEQAVGNLVDNALQHGGGEVALGAVREDGEVQLHVRSGGPGFPPEFLERAFDRFSRADDARAGDGTGLGLAIVETIARAHGGSAHVENRPDGGVDAWIAIPAR